MSCRMQFTHCNQRRVTLSAVVLLPDICHGCPQSSGAFVMDVLTSVFKCICGRCSSCRLRSFSKSSYGFTYPWHILSCKIAKRRRSSGPSSNRQRDDVRLALAFCSTNRRTFCFFLSPILPPSLTCQRPTHDRCQTGNQSFDHTCHSRRKERSRPQVHHPQDHWCGLL